MTIKQEIIDYLELFLRNSIGFLYKWLTTDGEVLGYILATIHILISTTLLFCSVYCHTIYPFWPFKLGVFLCMLIVWLQHIFLNVCVFTVAELRLTNFIPPSNIYLSYFFSKLLGTNVEQALITLVLVETVGVVCFFLELISELSLYLYKLNGII